MRDITKEYQKIKELLIELGFTVFTEDEEEGYIFLPFSNQKFSATIGIRVEEDCYVVESAIPVAIPEEVGKDVAWYVSTLNAYLKIGNFFIYPDKLEVAYRSTGLFESNKSQLEKLIHLCLNMTEGQIKPIMSIAYGEKDPDSALEELFSQIQIEENV